MVVPPVPGALSLFPYAPKLPDGNLVVPHGMREMLLLKHLGFEKIPNPMLLYYDWCKGKPFAVQRATCKMLTEHPRAYVLNAMGTGKTKCALWAHDYMRKTGLAKKALVVAPLSTLNFVWAREAFATVPHLKVKVLHGTRADRLQKLSEDVDIYIINHHGVKVIAEALHARADIDTLILDELAVYRNNSDRSKLMRKFAARFNIVWGMTGAPMPNEPTDVWAQCKIVTPGTVPNRQTHARDMLMTKVSTFKWVPKPNAVDMAFRMMQPAVRYALDDVVELPPMIPRMIDVDMAPQQQTVYQRILKDCKAMIRDKVVNAVNAGVVMSKLLQVAGGWVYTQSPEFVRLDASPRIVALIDLIESAEHKVIVFVPYRHAIEGLSKIFAMDKVKIDHDIIHGGTKDREQVFARFQNTNRPKVLLAHPGTLSHGLTLTAADTVVWYLPITSLETYEQANARIRRVGQAHKQQLLHLQATSVEKRIYSMLRSKQKIQDQLLQLFEMATEDLR